MIFIVLYVTALTIHEWVILEGTLNKIKIQTSMHLIYIYDEIQPKELSLKSISPWPRIIWMDSSLLFLELQTILLK